MSKFPTNKYQSQPSKRTNSFQQSNQDFPKTPARTVPSATRTSATTQNVNMNQSRFARRFFESSLQSLLLWVSIALIIFLFINIASLMETLSDTSAEYYDVPESTVLYTVEDGDFAYLSRLYARADPKERINSQTLTEGYHVACYYDKAAVYKAYVTYGDTAIAEQYKADLLEHRNNMGDLSYCADDIDLLFGISLS